MADALAGASGSRLGADAGAELRSDGPLVGAARKVEDAARRVKDKVVSGVGEKTVKEIVQDSKDFVRENPGKTILISLGVGALVGYLIGRRR